MDCIELPKSRIRVVDGSEKFKHSPEEKMTSVGNKFHGLSYILQYDVLKLDTLDFCVTIASRTRVTFGTRRMDIQTDVRFFGDFVLVFD